MKILKYKKLSKGKYKITFDTNELILYENVIIKNNLLLKKNISLELLEQLLNENKYYEIYDLSLSYIETKLRTENEVKEYLNKKNYELKLIEEIIEKLKNEGYINEKKYIESFINDKVKLSNNGPYKIKRNLLDLNLNEELIDNYLNTIHYNIWEQKLEKIIEKRIKMMKNKSSTTIKNTLRIDLYNNGYQKELIEKLINKIEMNDTNALEKDYNKAYVKYSKKYSGNNLKMQIKMYLYKKGYSNDDINTIIEN